MKYTNKTFKLLTSITLVLFLLFLLWGLWLKFNDIYMIKMNYINLLSHLSLRERFLYDIVPFQYKFDVFNQIKETIYNSFIFIPIGIFLNILFDKKNILRDILICFGISLSIELLQLFTMIGSFSSSDLIMNTLGYFLSLPIYYLIIKKLPLKFNIILFLTSNILLSIILVYAFFNTLIHLDVIIGILTRTL